MARREKTVINTNSVMFRLIDPAATFKRRVVSHQDIVEFHKLVLAQGYRPINDYPGTYWKQGKEYYVDYPEDKRELYETFYGIN